MSRWRDGLRRILARLGYTVHRWPANRFDGMRDALSLLAAAGYRPRVIIDVGAHTGGWARLARSVFPGARCHLIEPQPRCRPALSALAREGAVVLHAVAVTEPGVARVRLIGAETGDGTGGRVASAGDGAADGVECEAATLDALLADRVTLGDRALLKLDLEGHELPALSGGRRLLEAVEVVLAEVPFFDIEDTGRPVFGDVLAFLRARGFELYDVAGLAARSRDLRLRLGDVMFVRHDSPLYRDRSWQ